MRLYSFVAAAALLSASLAAHADVMYSFVGAAQSAGTTFTIVSPDFLTYSGDVPIALTTSSDLFFNVGDDHPDLGKLVSVNFFQGQFDGNTTNSGVSIFGGPYTINKDGVYTAQVAEFQGATLTISGSPAVTPVAATPEPSSLALLGTGLLGVVGVMRKRFA